MEPYRPDQLGPAIVAWGSLALVLLMVLPPAIGRLWRFARGATGGALARVGSFPPPLARRPAPAPASAATADPDALLWLRFVNGAVNLAPHLLITGASGSGKTTLASAILAERADQRIILTPKIEPAGGWGGAPIVTIDDDGGYTDIAAAARQLLAETRRRLVAVKRGQPAGAPLTIVLDDFAVMGKAIPEVKDLLLLVARLGRALGVRLVLLSYSDKVLSNGLAGDGDSLVHFVPIVIDRERRAVLTWESHPIPLDTAAVPALAAQRIEAARWYVLPSGANAADGRTDGRTDGSAAPPTAPIDGGASVRPSVPPGDKLALIARLVADGWSATDVRSVIRGENAAIGELVRQAQTDATEG